MDSLEDFSPVDTSKCYLPATNSAIPFTGETANHFALPAGFININAIRLKKYGLQKVEDGKSLTEL